MVTQGWEIPRLVILLAIPLIKISGITILNSLPTNASNISKHTAKNTSDKNTKPSEFSADNDSDNHLYPIDEYTYKGAIRQISTLMKIWKHHYVN